MSIFLTHTHTHTHTHTRLQVGCKWINISLFIFNFILYIAHLLHLWKPLRLQVHCTSVLRKRWISL